MDRESIYRLRAPSPALKFLEVRAVVEALSVVPSAPWLASQPRGAGQHVLVIPGFGVSDAAMQPLRLMLRSWGYRAHPWGLGVNRGRPQADAERLLGRLNDVSDQPVALVGWSLGGVIARMVAQARPDRIRQVITLGTPVEGGPKYTLARDFYAKQRKMDLDAFESQIHAENCKGLRVPLTVIYSTSDGVVGWRAAVDRYNAHAHQIRFRSVSHLGLILNPGVWIAIGRALAHPPPIPN